MKSVRGVLGEMPEIAIYVSLNEKQLKRYDEPREGIFICESEKVIRRALAAGYRPISFFVEEKMEEKAEALLAQYVSEAPDPSDLSESSNPSGEIPVYVAPQSQMKEITGYSLTGGMLCAMRRKPMPDPGDLIKKAERIVILDDIENPTNVGAIFRSAAALGADAVFLTKGCADPLYRRAARVSMGTVFQIPWSRRLCAC